MKLAIATAFALFPSFAFASSLAGTEWKAPFQGNPDSVQIQYSFKFTSETDLKQVFRIHSVSPIGDDAMLVTHYASYVVGAAVSGVANAQTFDITSVRLTNTPLDDGMTESFNHQNECGFHDWETGVEKDVTGIVCEPGDDPMHPGDKFYDIIAIDGTHLQTGFLPENDATVGATPDHRPTSLDPSTIYDRVSP